MAISLLIKLIIQFLMLRFDSTATEQCYDGGYFVSIVFCDFYDIVIKWTVNSEIHWKIQRQFHHNGT